MSHRNRRVVLALVLIVALIAAGTITGSAAACDWGLTTSPHGTYPPVGGPCPT